MARNQKLTGVLKGRTISAITNREKGIEIRFADGSMMSVKSPSSADSAAAGRTVKAVRQRDTTLCLDFESGETTEIQTAEPTASVMVRDKNNRMEYAD